MSAIELIKDLLAEIELDATPSPEQVAALRDLLIKVVERGGIGPNAVDLTVALSALDELLDASSLFAPWRDRPKVTVFGSARTRADSALYAMARALSAAQREQLGEYLLGQQDPAAERETHAQLEDSASGRAWAQSLATELAPLAAQPLPQIPAGRAAGIPAARAASMTLCVPSTFARK